MSGRKMGLCDSDHAWACLLTWILEPDEEAKLRGVACDTDEQDRIAAHDQRQAVVSSVAYWLMLVSFRPCGVRC